MLILPLTAAQEGAYHLCMACLEPRTTGPPLAPRKTLEQMAQSFRTSSCFVGEYFNWLKLNRIHPGKRGGVYCTQTSRKKEYAVLNDDPGRYHHKGDRGKSPMLHRCTPEVRERVRPASQGCAHRCPAPQPSSTHPHSPFSLGFQSLR